jgi:uncharacterized RDD family membrane protein YckC
MTGFERGHTDSSRVVTTPEGVEFVLYPAGLLVRICAGGIDLCAQGMILLVLVIGTYLAALGDRAFTGTWLTMILMFGVDWFYHVAFELLGGGQSPGKRIFGLRVVQSDGSPVTPGASLLRNLLRFADTFMFLYLIVLVCMAASRGFRRLGDWAADTLVVYTSPSQVPVRRDPLPWISALPAVNPPRRLSYEEKQGILMFARRYPLLGKARGDEIARDYVEGLRGGAEASGHGTAGPAEYLLGIARRLSGDGTDGDGT